MSNRAITPAEAAAELLLRRRARTKMAEFCQYVLGVSPALHHLLICEYLQRMLHDDEFDELIILAPPGSAKSTYTSWALPPFAIGTSPTPISLLMCSYATELAERWGRKVRNVVGGEKFSSLFPSIGLSRDSMASGRWATERGDELYAAGVGSGILGFRADLAVIDDPISGFEEAQSMTQLGKVHSWYETDFITRLKPKAKMVLICQRLARNDLAGYLIDRNLLKETRRQVILKLPMEAGANDPLGRAPGERLWPEWFTQEMVEDAKRDDFKWRTLYQQEPPSDDGAWVSTEDIQFRPSPAINPELPRYALLDLALSVNTGDYTVHIIVQIDTNQDWDIVHAERARVDSDQSAQRVIALQQTYRAREWLVDDDNASKVFGQLVATQARISQVAIPWRPMPMRGQNKEIRAAATRGQFKRRKVYMPHDAPWTSWLVKELLTFPNAQGQGVDDGVDALGLMGRRMAQLARPALQVVKAPLPTMQDMTLDGLWETAPKRSRRI